MRRRTHRARAQGLGRAARDALLAAAAVACAGLLLTSFDVFERIAPMLMRFEWMQLDDLLLTSVLAVIATSWFALRRLRDSMRQLAALRASELEKARYVERLEQLSAELVAAEERERTRLAEALHDEVGQVLYACRLRLEALAPALDAKAPRRLVAEARDLADEAMEITRLLTAELSPPVLEDLGLAAAIEWLLPRLEARYGVRIELTPAEAWSRVPPRCRGAVFHALRELVVNACKHAGSERVVLAADVHGGAVRVHVSDAGRGFDPRSARSLGFGLLSVERRMACLKGSLELRSEAGRGTQATLIVPGALDGHT